MNLINNRYRVIRNVIQSRLVSTYIVSDVMNNHELLNLNIINSEYVSDGLLSFLKKEFITIASIDHSNILKVFDFGLIYSVDNKILDTNQYFYTSESIGDEMDFADIVYELKTDEIIDVFVKTCQAIYHLHLKGITYSELNFKNILLLKEDEEYSIKLKDLVTIELDKSNYWIKNQEHALLKAPEISKGNKPNIKSDIYSLGVFLLCLCSKMINESYSLTDMLNRIKQASSEIHENSKFLELVELMTNQDPSNRPESIYDVISEINNIFSKDYKAHISSEMRKLNFNIKLTGREKEIDKIVQVYEAMKKHSENEKTVFIHGELGIGKTRFLREVDTLLSLNKGSVYSSFILDSNNSKSNKALIEILKQIIPECEQELIERYQAELVKFIPELGERKKVVFSETLSGDKEKFRLLSRIQAFIFDFAKNRPLIFIIDNAEFMDAFSIELLENICINNINSKNILIVLSYSNSTVGSNERFSEFLSKTKGRTDFLDISLGGLNLEETAQMIRDIMSMAHSPTEFAARIFSTTYGNPLFIQETIKDFFSKNIIYREEKTGKWYMKYDDYDQIPIPSSMEQAALNQIKEIGVTAHEILNVISVFNNAVSIDILSRFLPLAAKKMEMYVNELSLKGILVKKIEDRGFVYDFYNKVLKNIIYNKLSEEEKTSKHEFAAATLEKQYQTDGIENREELIYHLEKAGEKEKVVKYCMENAEKMEKLKIRDVAVKNLEKAASMFEESDSSSLRVELLIKIGNLYVEDGNVSLAIDYYKKANKIAEATMDKRLQVDLLNKIASTYFKKNNITKTFNYVKKCQEILKKLDYLEGYLECNKIICTCYLTQQKYDAAYDIATKCLELCGDNHIMYKGYMYNIIGNIYIDTSKIPEALENLEQAMKCFQQINYTNGVVMILNNLGVIYADFYQDVEKALHNFMRGKELSERNNNINSEILNLTNIASSYLSYSDYESSYEYFKEALEKSKKVEYESNIFYCYNYLTYVAVKLNKYSEAYEYYKLAEKELADYPEHGKEIALHHYARAQLHFQFGNINKASVQIQKALKVYKNNESTMKLEAEALKGLIDITKNKSLKDIDASIKYLKEILKRYTSVSNKMDIVFDACIVLYENGYRDRANRLLKEFSDSRDIKSKLIEPKEIYFRTLQIKGNNRVKCLDEALEGAKVADDKKLQWKIYNALGDCYYAKKSYFYAVNYYFEACEIIKSLTLQLPDDFKINFIKRYNMVNPFNRLRVIKNHYKNIKLDENRIGLSSVKALEDIEGMFNYEDLSEILNNKYFINSAKKLYKSSLPTGLSSFGEITKNLNEDPVVNLQVMAKLIAGSTLATTCMILSDDRDQGINVVASSNESKCLSHINYVISTVKDLRESILFNDTLPGKNNRELLGIPRGIKAVMCIPIMLKSQRIKTSMEEHRASHSVNSGSIKGYIYMESEKVLNNFTESSLTECEEMVSFIAFIIDKYQLKVASSLDKLTGVHTRKFLEDALVDFIEKSASANEKFSILMFDLDNFKGINDRFGHQTGDEVLKQVCSIVTESIRKEDFCGRYGGEEFIVILPGTDSDAAIEVSERIRKNIESNKILGDKREVTISIGIVTYPSHGQWKQELIENADQALYVSKATGRNKSTLWENDFSLKAKGTDKLAGIINGNVVQDSRNVLVMVELLELIKSNLSFKEKVYNLLGRIIEFTEAQQGMLFLVDNNKVVDSFGRRIFEESWTEAKLYNKNILDKVILSKQGAFNIDWDGITGYDSVTGMPDWHSIAVVPLINSGDVKGVLYLTVSTKIKEFKFEDYNLINALSGIAVAML